MAPVPVSDSLESLKRDQEYFNKQFQKYKHPGNIIFYYTTTQKYALLFCNGPRVRFLFFFFHRFNNSVYLYWPLKCYLPCIASSHPLLLLSLCGGQSFSWWFVRERSIVWLLSFYRSYAPSVHSSHPWFVCYLYYGAFGQIFNMLNFICV